MSGAEVVGIVSGIIAMVDAVVKIYDAAQATSNVPDSFRDVFQRLPLVKDSMIAVQSDIVMREGEESLDALERVLESCRCKVESLEKIYRRVMVAPEASTIQRYISAIRKVGKGREVEDIMRSVLADVQILTASYSIKASTRGQIHRILKQEQDMVKESPVDRLGRSNSSFTHYGTGSQHIVVNGNQNINSGSGGRFISGVFHGPFSLDAAPDGEDCRSHVNTI